MVSCTSTWASIRPVLIQGTLLTTHYSLLYRAFTQWNPSLNRLLKSRSTGVGVDEVLNQPAPLAQGVAVVATTTTTTGVDLRVSVDNTTRYSSTMELFATSILLAVNQSDSKVFQ